MMKAKCLLSQTPGFLDNERCRCSASLRRLIPRCLVALWIGIATSQVLQAQSFFSKSEAIRQTSQGPGSHRPSHISVDFEGFTEPKYDILVAATEIGRLASVSVEIGAEVEKGQVIGQLEDALQQEAVSVAQFRVQMRGEIEAASAEAKLKRLRLEQLKSLDAQSMARPDELKRALTDWEIAQARQLAASEQEQLRKLELQRYRIQLERRKIKAPMTGVVAEIFHSPGEYITPASPAIIRLVVMDQIYGVFNIPVEEIRLVRLGDLVSVHLMSASETVHGTVESIAPDIDGESGTIEVRVLIDNAAGKLRAGDRCQMKPMKRSAMTTPSRSQIETTNSSRTETNLTRRGGTQVR